MLKLAKFGLAVVLAALAVGCQSAGAGDAPSPPPPVSDRVHGEGQICAGIAGFQCTDGLYCDMTATHPDAAGVCKRKPQMCTREYRPVCGMDGKTYGNACTAAAAGISVKHPGECAA